MIIADEIVAITQNVFSTMLGMEISGFPAEAPSEISERVTGCIQISGQWRGAVVVQTSAALARQIAGRLFDAPDDDVSDSDLRDAFAELTNMIGGNIKSQVPCPSYLSMPAVTTGLDFDLHLAGAAVIEDVSLDCDGRLLRIALCEEDLSMANRSTQRRNLVAAERTNASCNSAEST